MSDFIDFDRVMGKRRLMSPEDRYFVLSGPDRSRRPIQLPPELQRFVEDLEREIGPGRLNPRYLDEMLYRHFSHIWGELEHLRVENSQMKEGYDDTKIENEELHEEIETLTDEREALQKKVEELNSMLDEVNYHGAR